MKIFYRDGLDEVVDLDTQIYLPELVPEDIPVEMLLTQN